MKYLEDLPNEWPWNPTNISDMSDKEIHEERFEETKRKIWRIRIYAPSDGYAYVGIKVHVNGKSDDYESVAKLRYGYYTNKSVFGDKWDIIKTKNDTWTPLGFPLTNHILAITEDSMDILIHHQEPEDGFVELIAQRLGDFQEETRQDIFYAFQNQDTLQIEWILYPRGHFVRPIIASEYLTQVKVKIIPSLHRILDTTMPPWGDRSLFYSAPLSSLAGSST